MDKNLDTSQLAQRMRELLDQQGFERKDVIRFATLLLEGVISEVKSAQPPAAR